MRNLSIAGKIAILKTLAISKIVRLALVMAIPNSDIIKLDKIKKHFIQKNGNPKIKQDTRCKDYENGGLKTVNITFKIISLQVPGLNDSMIAAYMNGNEYLYI